MEWLLPPETVVEGKWTEAVARGKNHTKSYVALTTPFGINFSGGQAECWLQFTCYEMQTVACLESLYRLHQVHKSSKMADGTAQPKSAHLYAANPLSLKFTGHVR